MKSTSYGLKSILLPAVASVGLLFSGLESKAQSSPYYWMSKAAEKSGQFQYADQLRQMEMEETMKSAVRQENEERDKRIARQNNSRPVQVQQQVVYETKKEEKPMYVSGDGKIRIFVCNYWKDFNENGVLDLEECVGINNNFKQKDVICPVVQIFNSKGKKYEQRLYGPKGQKIEVLCFDRILPLEDQAITPYTQELLKILKKELSEAGVGAFKQVVYIDDKYTGSFEFTIEE